MQKIINPFYYLWVVESNGITRPKRNDTSTTPRNNIWCPVGATSYMACFKHGRRHLERCGCGVARNAAVAKPTLANKHSTSSKRDGNTLKKSFKNMYHTTDVSLIYIMPCTFSRGLNAGVKQRLKRCYSLKCTRE